MDNDCPPCYKCQNSRYSIYKICIYVDYKESEEEVFGNDKSISAITDIESTKSIKRENQKSGTTLKSSEFSTTLKGNKF